MPPVEEPVGEPVAELAEEEAEEAVVPPVAEEVEEVEEVEAKEPAIREAEEMVAARPDDHRSRLALARAYRDSERWNDALAQYERLVKAGALMDAVIEDVEQVIAQQAADHATYLLLGDAYMKDGRLRKALAAYREAMARL